MELTQCGVCDAELLLKQAAICELCTENVCHDCLTEAGFCQICQDDVDERDEDPEDEGTSEEEM